MKKIIVNCERNDVIDIKCGGPEYLGFDFYVEDNESDEMIDFIKRELVKNHRPLSSIIAVDVDNSLKAWSKDDISKCIKEGY